MEIGSGKVTAKRILDVIDEMSQDEFEQLCRDLAAGMRLEIQDSESYPWGIRLKGSLRKDEELLPCVIALKRGVADPVDLQEVTSEMSEGKGMFVSTTGFTNEAKAYAKEFNVNIFDGFELVDLLRRYNLYEDVDMESREIFLQKEGARFLPSVEALESYMKKGNGYLSVGNYEKALEYLSKALEMKPNYAPAWTLKARVYDRMGEYDLALEAAKKALEFNINKEDLWLTLGNALSRLGRYEEEIECYDRALSLNEKFPEAWNNKGIALYNMKRYEEAIDCYDRALKLDPNNEKTYNNKGVALKALGKDSEALECYDKALSIRSKFMDAWVNKALLLQKLGAHEDALSCFDSILEVQPDNELIWYQKGLSYMSSGDVSQARKAFEEALRINPRLKEAKEAIGSLGPAQPEIDEEEYPCFGQYDETDEGCQECEIRDKCKEKSLK